MFPISMSPFSSESVGGLSFEEDSCRSEAVDARFKKRTERARVGKATAASEAESGL